MPQGRKGHIGIAKETTFKTAVAATDYTRFRRESLTTDNEEVISPEIQAVFDEGPSYQGERRHAGDVMIDSHPAFLGFPLLGALGPVTTTNPDAGVRWRHTFAARQTEFSAEAVLQPFTFEIHRDLGQAFRYAGALVNTIELAWGVDEKVLFATFGVIAAAMTRITATTPTFETARPFLWNECAVTLPDPTAFTTMRSLRVRIENNVGGLWFIDGSREAARIRPTGFRVVTVAGTMLASSAEFDAYDLRTIRALKAIFTGPTLGTGNIRLELNLPQLQYVTYPVRVEGPDEQMVGFTAKGKYDAAVANTPLQAVLDNAKSAY